MTIFQQFEARIKALEEKFEAILKRLESSATSKTAPTTGAEQETEK